MTLLNFANVAIHAIVVYAWGLFPALLAWMSRKPAASPAAFPDDGLPRVAILLSAHNEESHIAARVRNLIAMDYPADRWSAFIGVDGSRDRTAAFARAAAAGQPNIVVFDFPENRGKVSVLKDLAGRGPADYGIIGFTDANTDFEPQALRMLMAPFVDAVVGGV